MRKVVLQPGEDGMWVAEVPSLPGCISQGATREEAILNIRDAIEVYLDVLSEKGKPVPPDHFDVQVVVLAA